MANEFPYKASSDRYSQMPAIYSRCGKSGVLLPKVSLGFWHNFGDDAPFERSRAICRYAFDHGVTFISTKAGYLMWDGPYGEWGSRKYLMSSLDQSLKRMRLDYVDLFYSHRYDPNTPIEETLQTLVDVVKMGKALYVGISNWPLEPLKAGIQYLKEHDVPLLIYQGRLNMLDRKPINEGILDLCADAGVGFIAYSPLAQGLLTDRYLNGIPADSRMAQEHFLKSDRRTPELLEYLHQLEAKAQASNRSIAQEALKWVLDQKGVTSVLVGASSVEQLKNNLQTIF